jgi:hypothetical protein
MCSRRQVRETVPWGEGSQKLRFPLGKGQAGRIRKLHARLGNKQTMLREHGPHIMACEVVILSLDTVDDLGMRSKGLIGYRKHESPLYIGFSSIYWTCFVVTVLRAHV